MPNLKITTATRRSRPTPKRAAADLAKLVRRAAESLPPEDRHWLTDPIRHAAASIAGHLIVGDVAAAEAAVHEVQTWALLAVRHGHWSHDVADDLDRRCEAILDDLEECRVRNAERRMKAAA